MITKARHALFHRIDVRAWVVALALGCLWLNANAVGKNNIGRVQPTSNGRSTTIGPVTNSGGSTIPVSPNLGGWTQAGNYGVPPGVSGTTMIRGSSGETFIAGQKYPFQAGYQQPKYDWIAPALGGAAMIGCTFASGGLATAACLGLPVALPYLYDWIKRAGGRVNPETGGLERQNPDVPQDLNWRMEGVIIGPYAPTRGAACAAANDLFNANMKSKGWQSARLEYIYGDFCDWYSTLNGVETGPNHGQALTQFRCPAGQSCLASWLPSSMDDIAPYMRDVIPDGRVWGEAIEKGVDFPQPLPTITGPSQIPGPEKSTTNPDGSRTVERTTNNYQTSGNTITNTTNVTNTTTYNTDNSVRSTSTTTTTPTAEEADKEDECEKRPNTIGCADMDTPDGEIPRETKTITYAEEPVFGGGSCPSDKQWSSGTTGQSYKLVDWGTLCGFALPARALVILLAIFAAFLIVMPGKEVRT